MNHLQVMACIWRNGADMKLLDSGEIELINAHLVPTNLMSAAEEVFPDIEEWFKSWKDATPMQITMRNILLEYCGWTRNTKILQWLDAEESETFLFHDWTVVLAKNGWSSPYEDYRQYENDETDKLAQVIYDNACKYMKSKAVKEHE